MKALFYSFIISAAMIFCPSLATGQEFDCTGLMPHSGCEQAFLNLVHTTLNNAAGCKQWDGPCDKTGIIYRRGKVSIGTSSSSLQTLTVTEGVITPDVKICEDPNSWCDYVFDEDYELLPLQEVKEHIEVKGHLHKTPPAAEIEAEGSIDVGDVALDHQEKIEEVFLHLIELKKRADVVQERLAQLQAENKELKKEMEGY